MAEAPTKIESMRKWVVEHKLRAVGNAPLRFLRIRFLSPRIYRFSGLDSDVSTPTQILQVVLSSFNLVS
jgi:hypothetical protein